MIKSVYDVDPASLVYEDPTRLRKLFHPCALVHLRTCSESRPACTRHVVHPDDAVIGSVRDVDPACSVHKDATRLKKLLNPGAVFTKPRPAPVRHIVHAPNPVVSEVGYVDPARRVHEESSGKRVSRRLKVA